ncbi:MAG TPA: response regulator transcription factor [Terriglobales bacterium]|nr:response regulator transcription factor [Terriglobales bacterium]
MVRVRIVARSAVSAAGFEAVLLAGGRCEISRSAADVVLVEAGLSLKHALERVREHSESACIVIADNLSRRELLHALHSGVLAVLPTACSPEELLAAIEAAAAGLAAFTPEQLERLLPSAADPGDGDLSEPLTARESQVLELLAQGLANKEISAALHVSEHTVKFHVSSIIAKLGVAGRTEAVSRGVRDGLILL